MNCIKEESKCRKLELRMLTADKTILENILCSEEGIGSEVVREESGAGAAARSGAQRVAPSCLTSSFQNKSRGRTPGRAGGCAAAPLCRARPGRIPQAPSSESIHRCGETCWSRGGKGAHPCAGSQVKTFVSFPRLFPLDKIFWFVSKMAILHLRDLRTSGALFERQEHQNRQGRTRGALHPAASC